jgi:phenylacetate-CoA ligase
MFGDLTWVPSLFTYDPSRIFVEFGPEGRLIVTTLHQHLRLPLIRYATGDIGHFLSIPERLSRRIEEIGIPWSLVSQLPIVAIMGRGRYVSAAAEKVFPEAVKEGIYFDADLARLTTANFRLNTSGDKAHIRIQLCPGISTSSDLEARFSTAIARYVKAPLQVSCESYASFGSGMTLDYERKFDYFNN